NQAEDFFPAAFFVSFRTRTCTNISERGNERKNHESNDSAQNNSTTSHHTHAALLHAFARSASGQPATPRGLSQLHHCCGGPRPSGSHRGRWEHSNWYVFDV